MLKIGTTHAAECKHDAHCWHLQNVARDITAATAPLGDLKNGAALMATTFDLLAEETDGAMTMLPAKILLAA